MNLGRPAIPAGGFGKTGDDMIHKISIGSYRYCVHLADGTCTLCKTFEKAREVLNNNQ